jgi:H+/gluconate symporter-like permease
MKTVKSKFFLILIYLFGVMHTFAKPHPPHPNKTNEPPPPGLPIDMGIYLVFILALLYGIYIIYNHNIKQKTPT